MPCKRFIHPVHWILRGIGLKAEHIIQNTFGMMNLTRLDKVGRLTGRDLP